MPGRPPVMAPGRPVAAGFFSGVGAAVTLRWTWGGPACPAVLLVLRVLLVLAVVAGPLVPSGDFMVVVVLGVVSLLCDCIMRCFFDMYWPIRRACGR